jgi:hypothetical protein
MRNEIDMKAKRRTTRPTRNRSEHMHRNNLKNYESIKVQADQEGKKSSIESVHKSVKKDREKK